MILQGGSELSKNMNMNKETSVIVHSDIAKQAQWSRETFGPGERTKGVLNHIRKELDEIEADPYDITEWVDVIVLAFDGASRHGFEGHEIIDAYHKKMGVNMERLWPDWRGKSEDEPIEHIRDGDNN